MDSDGEEIPKLVPVGKKERQKPRKQGTQQEGAPELEDEDVEEALVEEFGQKEINNVDLINLRYSE